MEVQTTANLFLCFYEFRLFITIGANIVPFISAIFHADAKFSLKDVVISIKLTSLPFAFRVTFLILSYATILSSSYE